MRVLSASFLAKQTKYIQNDCINNFCMQSINLFFPFSNLGQVVSAWMIFRIGATLVPIIVFLSYGRNGKSSQHLEDPKSKTWIQIIVWDQMETNWIVVTQKPFGFCKKKFCFYIPAHDIDRIILVLVVDLLSLFT